jgi:hypothetical protein
MNSRFFLKEIFLITFLKGTPAASLLGSVLMIPPSSFMIAGSTDPSENIPDQGTDVRSNGQRGFIEIPKTSVVAGASFEKTKSRLFRRRTRTTLSFSTIPSVSHIPRCLGRSWIILMI